MSIPIIAKLRKAFVGTEGLVDAVNVDNDSTNQTGVVSGSANLQVALNRLDGTGVGAAIFRFTGSYAAQSSNMSEWFGNRQVVRMRCTDNAGQLPVTFTLAGTTALNTAFDALVASGLPEVLRLIIEYTGPSTTFVRVIPRSSPSPQIQGVSSVIVRSGSFVTMEITRQSGTLSSYIHADGGAIGDTTGGTLDALKLISPSTAVWDASTNGSLPTTGVVKGNAYNVVNAPADGSGRFGEVMQTDDWVVWDGDTFTSWSAEPHLWFVLPAHDVRRISALEQDFLTDVRVTTPVTDRNTVIRGANYADTAGEIRLKVYPTVGDYSAADLNTTGDIDEYTDPTTQTGILAVRLTGELSTLATVLPTLYVYSEDSGGNFTRLFNLDRDFSYQGDFSGESDYTSDTNFTYEANTTLRIYVGAVEDRYNIDSLDVDRDNLTGDVQRQLDTNHPNTIPAPLSALNNGAEIRNLTHSEFRVHNPHAYLNQSFVFLKNAPTTFPNTAGAFANELTGSATTPTDPSPVTAIQDVAAATDNVMTGAGITQESFVINTPDEYNWRLIIGGWVYYNTLPTSYHPILRIRERYAGSTIDRDVFGIDSQGFVFRPRATTGTTDNQSVRHPLLSTTGLIVESITASNLSVSFRVHSAESYLVQVTGYNGGALVGGQGVDYTITDVDVSQAATAQNYTIGAQTQVVNRSYTASGNAIADTNHTMTIAVDSLVSGVDELRVDVLASPGIVQTSTNNTYGLERMSEGHIAANRLLRYVISFRSVNGVETGNLEADYAIFGYDLNGSPLVFDENTVDLQYPALDLEWDRIVFGGNGHGIHQNIQGFFLAPDTPLLEYPRHRDLRAYLEHYDTKATQYCWGNIIPPNADTELVRFPEFVNFANNILVAPDGTKYRLDVANDGTLKTEVVT